jgi:hypothetical protein
MLNMPGIGSLSCNGRPIGTFSRQADCDAMALMRNALDVMLQRGWWVEPIFSTQSTPAGIAPVITWVVRTRPDDPAPLPQNLSFPDPFVGLVELNIWYRTNYEGKGQ